MSRWAPATVLGGSQAGLDGCGPGGGLAGPEEPELGGCGAEVLVGGLRGGLGRPHLYSSKFPGSPRLFTVW